MSYIQLLVETELLENLILSALRPVDQRIGLSNKFESPCSKIFWQEKSVTRKERGIQVLHGDFLSGTGVFVG